MVSVVEFRNYGTATVKGLIFATAQIWSSLCLTGFFSIASETGADGYCSRAVCHAYMMDKSRFLRNKVELIETGGQTHQIIH